MAVMEKGIVIPLGAYEVRTKSKLFPEDFWVTMQDGDRVLIELDHQIDHFVGRWVPVEDLDGAVKAGEVIRLGLDV